MFVRDDVRRLPTSRPARIRRNAVPAGPPHISPRLAAAAGHHSAKIQDAQVPLYTHNLGILISMPRISPERRRKGKLPRLIEPEQLPRRAPRNPPTSTSTFQVAQVFPIERNLANLEVGILHTRNPPIPEGPNLSLQPRSRRQVSCIWEKRGALTFNAPISRATTGNCKTTAIPETRRLNSPLQLVTPGNTTRCPVQGRRRKDRP